MTKKTYDEIMDEATEEGKILQPSSANDSKPETILVAAGPDKLDETTSIQTEILENQLRFTFTELMWAPRAFLDATVLERQARGNRHYLPVAGNPIATNYFKPFINNVEAEKISRHLTGLPYDAWMLVNMGPLGHGLMTRSTIPPHTLLMNYTGSFSSQLEPLSKDVDSQSIYMFGIQDSLLGYNVPDSFDPMNPPLYYNYAAPGIIDSQYYRNFSAFIQHAPTLCNLSTKPQNLCAQYIIINDDILQTIGTSNVSAVKQHETYIDGLTCIEFHARVEIPSHTMVFIDYGSLYWPSKRHHPELLTKQGARIDYIHYYPNELYLNDPFLERKMLKAKTHDVFVALLNKRELTLRIDDKTVTLSFEMLKTLTINHLGEQRFKDHLVCFLRKNPNVVKDYRTNRFHLKHPTETVNNESYKLRMKHFGFNFFNMNSANKEGDSENQLDAHPKLPMAAINSIARSN